jgi:hypothetical protein
MRRLAAVNLVALLLAGCGGNGGRSCAHGPDDAELCLVRRSGSYQVEGRGLKPGTEILTKVGGEPFGQIQRVGEDGRPRGVVGLMGTHLGRVEVEGVAAGGKRLHVTAHDG